MDATGAPCQSFSLSCTNIQANVWKSAKWGGEAIILMAGAAGVSDVGDVLELSVAKFLQSLTCLAGVSLHLYLGSSAEVAVVQSAGATACSHCLLKSL